MSVLFITHDLGVVGEIADHVVVMQSGLIQEQGTIRQIFEHPQHPYTKALLACRPRLDRRPKRLPVIDDFIKGEGRVSYEERKRLFELPRSAWSDYDESLISESMA